MSCIITKFQKYFNKSTTENEDKLSKKAYRTCFAGLSPLPSRAIRILPECTAAQPTAVFLVSVESIPIGTLCNFNKLY